MSSRYRGTRPGRKDLRGHRAHKARRGPLALRAPKVRLALKVQWDYRGRLVPSGRQGPKETVLCSRCTRRPTVVSPQR